MKRNLKNNWWSIVLFFLIACTSKQQSDQAAAYTCPMHPQIVQHKPGVCPICHMDLVLRTAKGKTVVVTQDLAYLLKPANALVISSIKTVSPVRRANESKVIARGVIGHSTEKLGAISARMAGRIERLFIKSDFQAVLKGQRIMEIYSPELASAQQELLYALKTDPENVFLINAAREKLLLLGLSAGQIDGLVKHGEILRTITVFSPMNGYVTQHPDAITEKTESSMPEEIPRIKEGMYVRRGEEVFTVVSHKDLWAEFDIYQSDVASVKLHDPAVVTIDNSYGSMKATIDRIQPAFESGQGLIKVRMRLVNPHHQYHAGQQVTATFESKSDTSWWIPATARIDMGMQNIVFLKRGTTFRPLEISVGTQAGEWLQVLSGLSPGDSLAYNAGFLVDSEDFVKIKSRK